LASGEFADGNRSSDKISPNGERTGTRSSAEVNTVGHFDKIRGLISFVIMWKMSEEDKRTYEIVDDENLPRISFLLLLLRAPPLVRGDSEVDDLQSAVG
jgi:hypothetical protein